MSLLCVFFGHRWYIPTGSKCFEPVRCKRCGVTLIPEPPSNEGEGR